MASFFPPSYQKLKFSFRKLIEIIEIQLNSFAGFIGYATDIYKLIGGSSLRSDDDDQLFYTKSFLDKTLRVRKNVMIFKSIAELLGFFIGKTWN